MKFTVLLVSLLVPYALALPFGDEDEDLPAPIQLFMDLHRAPPVEFSTTDVSVVETRWITQKLDNFDDDNEEEWQDRVLINDGYHVDGAPIFMYLGGEWEIQPGDIQSGHLVDMAKEHNASLVYPEHRYFGHSRPTQSLSTSNLRKYMNANQALADVANVIRTLKEEDKYKDSKVVVSGCSYSASMAVWLKQSYPDLIVGSWASSAPLEAKVDLKDFMKVVGQAYRELGGDYCYDIIKNGTSYFEGLFASGKGLQAKKELNLCDSFDIDNERDHWQLFSTIANVFANIAQYQKPETYDLAQYCSVLRSFSDNDYVALSKFTQWRLGYPKCVNTRYQGTVDYYKWSKENYDGTGLAWTFQTCNEFGWFQSSGSKKQPFGSSFPATLYTDVCRDVFGSRYSADRIQRYIDNTNREKGGIHPNVENVYMSHGGLDPWYLVGAGQAEGATIIPQHSHCPDKSSLSYSDSAALQEAKLHVAEVIRGWLA